MIISEFGAGLGDVITLIHHSPRYNILETLAPNDQALIVIMSNNPHTKEIFSWHPKAKQFDIRDVGFWWPWEDEEKRKEHKLPPAQPLVLVRQKEVKFYPSPEDMDVLKTLGSAPFIVVNVAAGGVDRNIPVDICEDAVQAIVDRGQREFGFRAVVIGRKYNVGKRVEYKFPSRPGLIDLTDQLSVPGTIELVARSRGVLCCHSAICLIAWYAKKPVFLVYPQHVKDREFNRPAHQYTFGKDFSATRHVELSEYKRAIFERWMMHVGRTSK